jgi:hypothetical protein
MYLAGVKVGSDEIIDPFLGRYARLLETTRMPSESLTTVGRDPVGAACELNDGIPEERVVMGWQR